jgi:hypothetical protein
VNQPDIFDQFADQFADYERARNAVKLLAKIRQERPDLFEQIQKFAKELK